ncbi:hypothetical protein [Variovorax guangxiensis]|uniref:PIG-L deacetylase family protein n=1 Tax=Variovorax guangxiensis TaxID=1775474 RepID=UPI002855F2BC|nr:hypothetical protein [Variovorax guangxiensis]MDR6856242.1 LmbE family N-acetylglucosaminyl deacetylase [Variovorax guangxiensis]
MGELDKLLVRFGPDTVITHFHADTHQDHATSYRIAVAAARKVSNFLMFKPTYPSGRPDIPFQPNVVSLLSKSNMDAKLRAINAFASQRTRYGDAAWAQAMLAVSQGDAWTYAAFMAMRNCSSLVGFGCDVYSAVALIEGLASGFWPHRAKWAQAKRHQVARFDTPSP